MTWINRIAIFPNLEMQFGSIRTAASKLCNYLPGFYILPFLHQYLPVVGVSTQIVLVMIHNNQITVSKQSATGVDYITTRSSLYRISRISSNINTFIDFPGC